MELSDKYVYCHMAYREYKGFTHVQSQAWCFTGAMEAIAFMPLVIALVPLKTFQ